MQEIIKEIAQTQQIDSKAARRFKSTQHGPYNITSQVFIVVVINEADSLSKDAQHGLRRTMEKYMSNLRIIFCCNSTSKIISPIRSRCLLVRVPAPEVEQVTSEEYVLFIVILIIIT